MGMARVLCWLSQVILRLRYRIRVKGLSEIAAKGTRGILFLPNHPGLIDPVIIMDSLYPCFRPRVLADRDQATRPLVRTLAGWFRVIPMRDPTRYTDNARAEVEQALTACREALRQGDNLLLYPSGRIYRKGREDLRGTSAVEGILKALPEVRVVLIRSTGLWGSCFTYTHGHYPKLFTGLFLGALRLLINGIFFCPRREVTLDVVEPADLPRQAGRAVLNDYLEEFYNRETRPNTYVPYTFWEKGGTRVMPEPRPPQNQGDVNAIPAATRDAVLRHLAEVTGKPLDQLEPAQNLAKDLGLDSLSALDLTIWLNQEFGYTVDDPGALATVGDVLLAACGTVMGAGTVELKPVPAVWFSNRPVPIMLPEGATIPAVFLKQARLYPDYVIVADQTAGARTWREVVLGVMVLKTEIAKIPGRYVGIMLPASAAAGIVTLAVQFAGKIPVMVNWTVGVRNMTHSLDLLGVRHVLTSARLVQKLEGQMDGLDGLKDRFIYLETMRAGIGLGAKLKAKLASYCSWRSLERAPVDPTAVILFTSGSESMPKAVPLTHLNLLTNLRDIITVVKFLPADRMIGILPPFHSFGLTGPLLMALCLGIPVVYHPNPTEGGMLAKLIAAYRVSLLVGTPTFLNGIVRAAGDQYLHTLRVVIAGAEKCPAQLFAYLAKQWPHLLVIEGYGITECSPAVSANRDDNIQHGTIGQLMPTLKMCLLDPETERPPAPGKPGMLYLRGPSIFGGYLNYDGASPFTTIDGEDWYRTGDLVTVAADGVLTFAGRLKRFVKLGGEMISLPAIEEVLVKHFVLETDTETVLAVESTPSELNPELVLFTIRDLDRDTVNRKLREAGFSPLYNIRQIRKIEKIPVLGTGKTDYRTLKDSLKETSTMQSPVKM